MALAGRPPAIIATKLLLFGPLLPDPLKRLGLALGLLCRLRLGLHRQHMIGDQLRVMLRQLLVRQRIAGMVEGSCVNLKARPYAIVF